jgi:hypothetical protein
MADFLGGLLSGGGGGLYDDLLTPQQQSQLSGRGLLAMAGAFADAGMPSRLPIPLGAAIGKAAAAMGTGRDQAALSLLKAGMTVQELKALQQKMKLNESLTPFLQRLAAGGGGGVPTPTEPAETPASAAPIPAAPVASATDLPPGGVPPGWPGPGAIILDAGGYGMPPRPKPLPWTGLTPSGPAASPALSGPPTEAERQAWIQSRVQGGQDTIEDFVARFRAGGGTGKAPTGLLGPAPPLPAGDAPPPDVPGAGASLGGLLSTASYGGGANGTPPFDPGAGGDDEVGSGGGDTSSPEYLTRRAQDLALVRKYESGDRNIMQNVVGPQGGYNPSVGRVTGPSSAGGYYQMIDPTWRSAASSAGIDTAKYPRAIDAPPELQTKAAEALYDKRGLADWAPYNKVLARNAGWSGPMGDGGGSGGGAAPLATPPGAGAALATPPGGGIIPGTGMTPQQLGALNALMKMGGLGDPFNSLLETYYKSPGYLGEAAGASKRGELGVELELRPKLEAAIAWAKIDPNINEAERKAQIDRYSKLLEQTTAAQTTTIKDVPVLDQNGQTVLQNMLQSEVTQNRADRAARAARGDTTPRPGDIVGTPFALGTTPPGYEYRTTPQGTLAAQPVPDTPAAREAQDVLRRQKQSDLQLQVSRDIVMQNSDRIENLVQNSALPTTGAGGAWLSRLGGTAANDVRVMVETLKARSSLDALNQMRQSSPTGGALGNVSNAEGDRLAAALSNLDQSQSQGQFLFNLRRAKQAYVDAVHGPGAYSALSDAPALKVPNAGAGAVARPEGSTDATLRSEAAAAIAGGRSRAAVIERLQKMGVSAEGL